MSLINATLDTNLCTSQPIVSLNRDMPTVVRVKDMGGDRAEILLRAVADEKTEHMAKLVARQRDSDYRYERRCLHNRLRSNMYSIWPEFWAETPPK